MLKEDFGSQFVKSCAYDFAGEIARVFFNMQDMYVTVDQLAKRIWTFSYDCEFDPLSRENVIKNALNCNDYGRGTEKNIIHDCNEANEKLFTISRKEDKLDNKARINYRKSHYNTIKNF